jgi:plasmid stability protein
MRTLDNGRNLDCNASIDYIAVMATITIRNLKDEVRDALRVQAAKKGSSLEAEVRDILERAVEKPKPTRADIERTVAEIQERLRAANNGELPDLVGQLLADRRAEAAKQLAEHSEPKS